MEEVGHTTSKRVYEVSLEICPFETGKFLVCVVDQTQDFAHTKQALCH